MQIGKSRTTEELSSNWENKEWRFKRHQENLHRKEFCFQVPRQVIWRGKPKSNADRRNWAQEVDAMRLGMRLKYPWCALGICK